MNANCLHISAGGTFHYFGEGPGAVRKCTECDLIEECYHPDQKKYPCYVQWKKIPRVERISVNLVTGLVGVKKAI